jgi:hypothetical protein
MDKILEKLNTEARKIFLDKDEKSAIRNILISYSRKSPFIFTFINKRRILVSALVILLLILGGGTSYAAERSLPGDILYPIKVNVNEKIAGLAALTPEARVKFEAKIIEKRLEEADKLAQKGNLNKDTKEKVEKGFEKASVELNKNLIKLIDKKDFDNISEINSVLDATFNSHQKSLGEKAKKNAISKSNIDSIMEKIQEKSDKNNEIKNGIEEVKFLNEINFDKNSRGDKKEMQTFKKK